MSYENRMILLKTLLIQTSPKTTPNTFPEHRFETRNCQARKLHSLKFKKNLGGPWPPWAITWLHHWCSRVLPLKLVSYTRLGLQLTVFSTDSIFFFELQCKMKNSVLLDCHLEKGTTIGICHTLKETWISSRSSSVHNGNHCVLPSFSFYSRLSICQETKNY